MVIMMSLLSSGVIWWGVVLISAHLWVCNLLWVSSLCFCGSSMMLWEAVAHPCLEQIYVICRLILFLKMSLPNVNGLDLNLLFLYPGTLLSTQLEDIWSTPDECDWVILSSSLISSEGTSFFETVWCHL